MVKNQGNKGFTLVELIIVVAIIAVLAAVLAPRYMQYVESARRSNDLQIATNMMRAASVAIADPSNDVPPDTDIFFVWETDDVGLVTEEILGRIYVDTTYNMATAGNSENNAEHEFEANLTESLGFILSSNTGDGSTDTGWEPGRSYYFIGEPESAAAIETDFKFSINSSTGNILFYQDKVYQKPINPGVDSYVWIDEIGVNPN